MNKWTVTLSIWPHYKMAALPSAHPYRTPAAVYTKEYVT